MATFQETVEELTTKAKDCLNDLYEDETEEKKRELESVVSELENMVNRAEAPDAIDNKTKFWIGLILVIAVYVNQNAW